jgi:hypothetical protein
MKISPFQQSKLASLSNLSKPLEPQNNTESTSQSSTHKDEIKTEAALAILPLSLKINLPKAKLD